MNLNATLFAQMVVFFILWWVVAKFIWPPLVKALDERAKKIADGLAAAEKGKADLESANKRAEQALTEAMQRAKQQRITVVVVTQRPALLNIVDKVLILRSGRTEAFGSPQDVLRRLYASKGVSNAAATAPAAITDAAE